MMALLGLLLGMGNHTYPSDGDYAVAAGCLWDVNSGWSPGPYAALLY